MPGLEHGLYRASYSIATGFIITTFLNSLLSDPTATWYVKFVLSFIKIAVILMGLEVIMSMKYWGRWYLLGWLIGYLIFLQTPLIGIEDYITGIFIPAYYFILKNLIKRRYK